MMFLIEVFFPCINAVELLRGKSSAHDESKISIYVSDVSDVSSVLRRLAFLPDTCQPTCQPCRSYETIAHHIKNQQHMSDMSDMSSALSRLAFLHDMCLRYMSDMSATRSTRRNSRPLVPSFQSPRGFLKGEPQWVLERRGSAVSHMSQALRRLAFLRDMCLKSRAAHVPHVPRGIRANARRMKNNIHMPHMSHMSQPLPRLAFLRDMCLRQHVAHVANIAHAARSIKNHTTRARRAKSLEPLSFFGIARV